MDDLQLQTKLRSAFVGSRCTKAIYHARESWQLHFDNGARVHVQCPWRIIVKDRIVLGNCDHDQQFSGRNRVDAQTEAQKLLSEYVSDLSIRKTTSDLVLDFSMGARLEILHHSSGYEGWECQMNDGFNVIALGGGEIIYFD